MAKKNFENHIIKGYRRIPGSWVSENLDNDNKFYKFEK